MILVGIISAVLFIPVIFYAFWFSKFINGWDKISCFTGSAVSPHTNVSILVPCKNEINHLSALFEALKRQTYPNFELILVDDHSTDGSLEFSHESQPAFPQLRVIKNTGFGKKSAIRTGIYSTENKLIVTLDADSIPPPTWLNTVVQFYEHSGADLIICPVKLNSNGSFFQDFQQFEFAGLVGSGAGAVGAGMPILCNGANLAFSREAWLRSENELHMDELSGDDIFLLQSLKRRGENIRFLKSEQTMTTTQPASDVKSFLKQRKRWASKKPAYTDKHYMLTAFLVFTGSAVILTSLILGFFDSRFLTVFLLLFLVKWATDFVLFKKINTFFQLKNVFRNSLLFSIIYPFYIVATAFASLGAKSKQTW